MSVTAATLEAGLSTGKRGTIQVDSPPPLRPGLSEENRAMQP